MSSEALKVSRVYRSLLRAVKEHIGNEDKKRHFREYVAEEFRKKSSSPVSDLSSMPNRIKLAQDYTYLLKSVHHQQELLFSYNIAVDRTEEMKRTLGKSAASVGLQLPETYQS